MTKDRNLARNELPDLLSDLEYDLLAACDSRLFGAQTAILELTKRPEITSWIMAASIPFPINMEPAYVFYRDGGKLLLARDAIHVLLTVG